jgi:ferredoxin
MKAIVDEKTCVGCGLCVETCPDVFEMAGAVAKSKVETVPKGAEAACKSAAADCPVAAISVIGG